MVQLTAVRQKRVGFEEWQEYVNKLFTAANQIAPVWKLLENIEISKSIPLRSLNPSKRIHYQSKPRDSPQFPLSLSLGYIFVAQHWKVKERISGF